MENRTTQEKATAGMLKEVIATVVQAVPAELSYEDAERIISNKNLLIKGIKELITKRSPRNIEVTLAVWRDLYKKEFNLDVDMSEIRIPEHKPGFDRLIVVAKGATLNKAYEACEKKFKCWKYTYDLEKSVIKNDRDPAKNTYAIWIRDQKEADEELRNLSSVNLKRKGIKGITLLERLVFELKFFNETGKHLDINNLTLCSGSSNSSEHELTVACQCGRVEVDWQEVDCSGGLLRSREVIS